MLGNFILATIMLLSTSVVHAASMVVVIRILRLWRPGEWGVWPQLAHALLIGFLVLMMTAATFVEVGMWSGLYLATGAIDGVEKATYFSLVTYTTLGYGDVILSERWRMLGALEAANGTLMLGWTTALIYSFVQRLYFQRTAEETESN